VRQNRNLCETSAFAGQRAGKHRQVYAKGKDIARYQRDFSDDESRKGSIYRRRYQFILIDWKILNADGFKTIQEIRKIVGSKTTIIIIFAYDWGFIEAEARAAGANMLISEPLLRSAPVSAFERVISHAQAKKSAPQTFAFTGKRVLLAEDNAINSAD